MISCFFYYIIIVAQFFNEILEKIAILQDYFDFLGEIMKKTLDLILKDFTNYLDFLRSEGYFITVSCYADEFFPVLSTLLEYEVHQPLICSYLKTQSSTEGLCAKNKEKLKRRAPIKPYYSCCYAGVEEFVIPIRNETKTLLCMNISGYRGKLEKSEIMAEMVARNCDQRFFALRNDLSTNVPCMGKIIALVTPFEYIVQELYNCCLTIYQGKNTVELAYNAALAYIYENYANKITLADIAATTNYTTSYFCRFFHKKSKKTPIEYLNNVRLAKAAELLKSSSYNITEIALLTGFDDPNYFSTLFKRKYGLLPKQLRQM